MSILNSNFTSTSTTVADVWSNAGSNLGIFKDIHSESGATNFLTTANSAVSQWWSLESVRAQDILVTAGGGTFDISNSNLGDIHRVDGNVPFSLSMRNTSMTNLVLNSTIKTNIYLNLDNIQYKGTGNFLAGSDPTDWHGRPHQRYRVDSRGIEGRKGIGGGRAAPRERTKKRTFDLPQLRGTFSHASRKRTVRS